MLVLLWPWPENKGVNTRRHPNRMVGIRPSIPRDIQKPRSERWQGHLRALFHDPRRKILLTMLCVARCRR
jgi:hypothetical protein